MTHKLQTFRNWLNKNDGQYFQVDNLELHLFEVLGHLLMIFSVMYYFLHEKVDVDQNWMGWTLIVIGLALGIYGTFVRLCLPLESS